jgi:DNA helicase-2/ATP-dependent DNA helicase PcrA
MFKLRPKQQEILTYSHGKMGISAVPGSGKTSTLSFLTADILKRRVLEDDQEILIVTLINSAVDNFYNRISSFVYARGLFPNIGYRVRTLHGLAHDIVRERPELVGLDSNFQIIDERESDLSGTMLSAWLSHLTSSINTRPLGREKEWVNRALPFGEQHLLSFIRYKDHLIEEHINVQLTNFRFHASG